MSKHEFKPNQVQIPNEELYKTELSSQGLIAKYDSALGSEDELFDYIKSSIDGRYVKGVHHEVELASEVSEQLAIIAMDSALKERPRMAVGLANAALANMQDFADTLSLNQPIIVSSLQDRHYEKITMALKADESHAELDDFYYDLYERFTIKTLGQNTADGPLG